MPRTRAPNPVQRGKGIYKNRRQRDLPLRASSIMETDKTGASHRPSYLVTDEQRRMVLTMASNGMKIEAMAAVLEIAKDTLRKHFKREIDHGHSIVHAGMGAVIVEAGLGGNVTAAKFWLVNRAPDLWGRPEELVRDPPERDGEVVHFYLPSNGRDQPELLDEPPIIDGEVEAA